VVLKLTPDKQTQLLSVGGRLERNTLERPERQTGREKQTGRADRRVEQTDGSSRQTGRTDRQVEQTDR